MILFGGVLLSLMERYILSWDFGMHIGALLVFMALFMCLVKYKYSSIFCLLCALNEKYSLWVYIIYILVWNILLYIAIMLSVQNEILYLWMQPILVIAFTILSGIVFYKYKGLLQKRICKSWDRI